MAGGKQERKQGERSRISPWRQSVGHEDARHGWCGAGHESCGHGALGFPHPPLGLPCYFQLHPLWPPGELGLGPGESRRSGCSEFPQRSGPLGIPPAKGQQSPVSTFWSSHRANPSPSCSALAHLLAFATTGSLAWTVLFATSLLSKVTLIHWGPALKSGSYMFSLLCYQVSLYSFIRPIFTEWLHCTKCCSRHWEHSSEQNTQSSYPQEIYILGGGQRHTFNKI